VCKEQRIWWATTLWCNPKYQGKGYGLIVIGSLQEAHEPEITLDRWGAQETVTIFTCLGYMTIYTPRYILGDKSINRSSIKGQLAYIKQRKTIDFFALLYKLRRNKDHYSLKYSSFINGESYSFMCAHRQNNLFVREQKMLNWILNFPFVINCELDDRVIPDTVFTSYLPYSGSKFVQVYINNKCVGVYIWHSGIVTYLYFEEEYKYKVFSTILDHAAKSQTSLQTDNLELAVYASRYLYLNGYKKIFISLSVPNNIILPDKYSIQLGDGDNFA